MKPNTNKKKLSLSTETLRTLGNDELVGVGGGLGDITASCFCGSAVCSIVGNCNIGNPPTTGK